MQKIFDLIFHGRGRKAIIARIVFVLLSVVLIGGALFILISWPEIIFIVAAILILAVAIVSCEFAEKLPFQPTIELHELKSYLEKLL